MVREKVIKGLECCLGDTRADLPNLCTICPYAHGSYATQTCGKKLREDALALLKAQEPVEPEPKEVIYDDVHRSVYCPSCDNRLAGLTYSGAVALETEETPRYCWMCGQAVEW